MVEVDFITSPLFPLSTKVAIDFFHMIKPPNEAFPPCKQFLATSWTRPLCTFWLLPFSNPWATGNPQCCLNTADCWCKWISAPSLLLVYVRPWGVPTHFVACEISKNAFHRNEPSPDGQRLSTSHWQRWAVGWEEIPCTPFTFWCWSEPVTPVVVVHNYVWFISSLAFV